MRGPLRRYVTNKTKPAQRWASCSRNAGFGQPGVGLFWGILPVPWGYGSMAESIYLTRLQIASLIGLTFSQIILITIYVRLILSQSRSTTSATGSPQAAQVPRRTSCPFSILPFKSTMPPASRQVRHQTLPRSMACSLGGIRSQRLLAAGVSAGAGAAADPP